MKLKAKVSQMTTVKGSVRNHFTIKTDEGTFFQSYNSIIAFQDAKTGKVTLDEKYWDYSTTTVRYRNQFLGEGINETRKKIKDGTYTLANLNK